MKGVQGINRGEILKMTNSPSVKGMIMLMKKVKEGTASPAEVKDFEVRTKRARSLDPRVLVD